MDPTGGSLPLQGSGCSTDGAVGLTGRRLWSKAGERKRLVIWPVLQDSQRTGGSQQGQETRSSWQLLFVLAIPSPLRPGSSEYIQEPCQGKLYLTCTLPDCLHSSWASHSGQGCPALPTQLGSGQHQHPEGSRAKETAWHHLGQV